MKNITFVKAINAGLNYDNGIAQAANASGSYSRMTTKETNQHYAIAIDSLTNKFFMDYASQTGNQVADTTSSDMTYLYCWCKMLLNNLQL